MSLHHSLLSHPSLVLVFHLSGNRTRAQSEALVLIGVLLRGVIAQGVGEHLLCNSQPAPKYHIKGCSHSSVDSAGVRTLF